MMDTPRRPLDFALLLHLKNAPGLEALRTGARSARNLYPATGSHIDEQHWIRINEPGDGISVISVSSTEDLATAIEDFIGTPLDLRKQMPVQQLVIVDVGKNEVKLLTRFHHAVADGLSAAMWISHQLRVAGEKTAPVAEASPFQYLHLRTHPAPVKKSRYAYGGASDPLWTSERKPTRARRWRTVEVAAGELREGCRRAGGFTYNDLLATCALQLFTRWNGLHSNGSRQKVSLWFPVNIRKQAALGFGNGTSRIRLTVAMMIGRHSLHKCREIRRQVSWSNRHGEWATPAKLPFSLTATVGDETAAPRLPQTSRDRHGHRRLLARRSGNRRNQRNFSVCRKNGKYRVIARESFPGYQRRDQPRADMVDLHLRSRPAINGRHPTPG